MQLGLEARSADLTAVRPSAHFDDASCMASTLCLQARDRRFDVLYEPRALAYHHVAQRAPGLDRADRPRRCFAYSETTPTSCSNTCTGGGVRSFLAGGSWSASAALGGWRHCWPRRSRGPRPRPHDAWSALRGKVEGVLLSRIGGAR